VDVSWIIFPVVPENLTTPFKVVVPEVSSAQFVKSRVTPAEFRLKSSLPETYNTDPDPMLGIPEGTVVASGRNNTPTPGVVTP
jgi:hypothetical protein